MFIEGYDQFTESFITNFGKGSRVVIRWEKFFNNVSSLVKKYVCIEDYPLGVYHLYFDLNNGKIIERSIIMNCYHYSEGYLVRWINDLEDEIYREGKMINVTASWDTEQKWVEGPKWKHEWEAKWDSAKDILNKKYGYLSTDKEGKLMTNYEYDYIASRMVMIPKIKDVIFNNPATIVKWADGTKTVVKVQKGEPYDEEKGLAMAFIKKIYDNKGNYNDIFRKWCPKKEVPKVDDFNGTVEEMFEDLFADDYVCESCKIDV